MLSSSGSTSPAGARTPTFNPTSNAISELSPPGSQTASHYGSLGEPSIASPAASFDQGGAASGRGGSWGANTSNPQQQQQQSKEPPGASWNNQRSQEEYTRAWDSVVDRDFSLRKLEEDSIPMLYQADEILIEEFGDPFDEFDMLEEFEWK